MLLGQFANFGTRELLLLGQRGHGHAEIVHIGSGCKGVVCCDDTPCEHFCLWNGEHFHQFIANGFGEHVICLRFTSVRMCIIVSRAPVRSIQSRAHKSPSPSKPAADRRESWHQVRLGVHGFIVAVGSFQAFLGQGGPLTTELVR